MMYFSYLQEHLNYVSEISQEELFILDPELVVTMTVSTSPTTSAAEVTHTDAESSQKDNRSVTAVQKTIHLPDPVTPSELAITI